MITYEVAYVDTPKPPVSSPLFTSVSVGGVEDFVAEHGYDLDPEEWYPG